MSLEITGQLTIELEHSLAKLELKGREIQVNFSSFTALREFHRIFRQKIIHQLPYYNRLRNEAKELEVSYYILNYPVAYTGPTIKPTWWAKYLGLGALQIDVPVLLKAIFYH